jgi:hypothetical protein
MRRRRHRRFEDGGLSLAFYPLTNGLNAGEHGDDTAESPIALTAELPVLAFREKRASKQFGRNH